jgi:hypothetical protein
MAEPYHLICITCAERLDVGAITPAVRPDQHTPFEFAGRHGGATTGIELLRCIERFLVLHRSHELRVVPDRFLGTVDPENRFRQVSSPRELLTRQVPPPNPDQEYAALLIELTRRTLGVGRESSRPPTPQLPGLPPRPQNQPVPEPVVHHPPPQPAAVPPPPMQHAQPAAAYPPPAYPPPAHAPPPQPYAPQGEVAVSTAEILAGAPVRQAPAIATSVSPAVVQPAPRPKPGAPLPPPPVTDVVERPQPSASSSPAASRVAAGTWAREGDDLRTPRHILAAIGAETGNGYFACGERVPPKSWTENAKGRKCATCSGALMADGKIDGNARSRVNVAAIGAGDPQPFPT